MVFDARLWHIPAALMKTMFLLALGVAVIASGCASTEGQKTVKVDPNARWVVVSTNDPVSSRVMEKGDTSKVPPRLPSVLLSPENLEARQEIENSGVTPVLKKKLLDGEVLTVADVEELGRYKVSEATTLKYLRNTSAVYILTTDDINRLQQAGVGKGVTDHMLATVKERPVRVVHRYHYPDYGYYDPWWDYPRFHYYHYYPHHYHHGYHGHHGHRHGGGIRVYRPR